MAYKLDSENRYESFLSEASRLYLQMVYAEEESVKSVRITTQEVPGGKTIEQLEAMGISTLKDVNVLSGDNEVKEVAPEPQAVDIELTETQDNTKEMALGNLLLNLELSI